MLIRVWTPSLVLLLWTLLLGLAPSSSIRPRRLTATIPGDIMVGALFSVHKQPGARQAQSRTCGDIWEQYGIHRVEAAFQTIDEINNFPNILPNITLGIEIRDSCWYSPTALEQSIEFIRDALSLHDAEGDNATSLACAKLARKSKNLIGVIGLGSSTTTIQVQNLLQLFNIPQISYSATSRELSNKDYYKYFLRVVPSDHYQAQVMVDIVKKYNWTFISAIHTDGNYGNSGNEAFTELAREAGICFAHTAGITLNAEPAIFDEVIRGLLKHPNARVVVCFCEGDTVRELFIATRRLNVVGKLLFIGSDGWADRSEIVESVEREAVGGISIRIYSPYVHHFDKYFFKLTPKNNNRNPWFSEFWEHRFNCSLAKGSDPPKYNRTCTGKENLADQFKQDPKMSFVKKSVWTFAHGLHNMQRVSCPGRNGLCQEMLPVNGSIFLQYLMNVSFIWGNETIQFDSRGDPPARYDIYNFQKFNSTHFDYVNVGSWNNGKLDITKMIQFSSENRLGTNTPPESVCSKPCEKGMIKSIQSKSVKCCWVCLPCKENEFLKDEFNCQECEMGWWPNDNLTECIRLPIEYIHWSHTTSIVAMSVACLGYLSTIFVMIVFVRHNNTPVVKASTRELSYIIMVGMYLCHGATFALVAKPTRISCFLSRILPGIGFALMYASLVTKTNRIARILAGSKKKIITKKPRFMGATAQVVISCLLISVEGGIIAAMLVFEPADPKLSYPTLNRVTLICNTTPLGIIAPLGFDFFLIAMCTVYAVKTRNVPENFNEAKFIGFAMYTTLVIWLAFIPTYFGSKSKVITMCLCVSFSAIVALVLLFFPKVYIILFRPEKNNRSAFTTAKNVRCHIGYVNSGVSRNSSHSTSDFSLESPRNHSLEVGVKHPKPAESRRYSLNIFERFRISKQDKIAASVAQHIRAVRAAEALDRRTRFRRTDSFHEPPPTKIVAQRSTSSGDESPERRKLVGMLKRGYGRETEEIPGFDELARGGGGEHRDEVACQTGDELLETWIPTGLRQRRVVRSETLLSTLTTPDDERPFYWRDSRNFDDLRSPIGELAVVAEEGTRPPSYRTVSPDDDDSSGELKPADRSQESIPDGGASSVVEESASSGSEDTSGSGIYKTIIINLGGSPGRSQSSRRTNRSVVSLQSLRSPTERADFWGGDRVTSTSCPQPALNGKGDNRHLNG